MKYIAHVFLLLLGLGAAFFRWIDLVNFTNLETGFVTAGSVWLRYAAIAVLVVFALVASFLSARRPAALEHGSVASGVVVFVIGAVCTMQNAVSAFVALRFSVLGAPQVTMSQWLSEVDFAALGIALLGLICGVWLFLVAFAMCAKTYRLPAGGVGFGIVGSFYFYIMLIARFAQNQSSYHNMAQALGVFVAAAVIWFVTVLLRAIYYPESNVGHKVYAAGMVCFYLCIGFALPQAVCDFMVANLTTGAFCEHVLFATIGLLGAIFATRAMSNELAV